MRPATEDTSERYTPVDFSKIKIGIKTLDDAVLSLGQYKRINPQLGDKKNVLRAMNTGDINAMRDISNFFYRTSGIYSRLCRYMAYLYKYDWFITPYISNCEGLIETSADLDKVNTQAQEKERKKQFVNFFKVLKYFEQFEIKKFCGEVALKVIRNGCYYGYLIPQTDRMTVQELHPKYTIKFNINEEDFPAFISVIPAIIDLDAAQELDRKKMAQKLLKIIIQRMPLDKNGDLIFDVDEAQQLHNNAVKMLSRAIGVDVLTTFADVDVADMSDKGTTTTVDELAKVERTVYNEAGVSQLQFNSDGNMALNNSILNDEASMYNLLVQFESFLNLMLESFNKSPKRCYYRAQFLTTTIYNYKEMAKLYKEQAQMGYSKMLPQVALGQTQSSVLANAYFENDVLDLVRVFVPPLTSNTMNADALAMRGGASKQNNSSGSGEGQAGRPEKEDNQKSDKTIQNRESM